VIDSVAIVGASVAGMHAAHTLRREGFAGRISVVDADAHLPYDRPPLSKQVLSGEWSPDRIVLSAANEDLDLDWHLGRTARGLDLERRVIVLDDGGDIGFDAAVIATGAAARRLPDHPDLQSVHLLRSLDDCLAIRRDLERGARRIVVVGAGFIGAEVAATCRGLDLEVTLLEVAPVPLERALGPLIGGVCGDLHREHGVDLRLGTAVSAFVGDRRVEGVVLDDGTSVAADVVIVGVGVSPNTHWLEGSGLTIEDGIVCDETLLAAPGVVAAGDIARWPSRRYGELLRVEHWETAVQQGEAAARRVLAGDPPGEPFDPVPWFWSDQYDRKIQLAGRSGADHDVELVHGSFDEKRFVALYGRDGVVRGVLGFNRPRHVMQLRQLVADRVEWTESIERAREL
jgi:3-phenylpropionate/trans-cinnamate dioxygenase ferredoxin reductase component